MPLPPEQAGAHLAGNVPRVPTTRIAGIPIAAVPPTELLHSLAQKAASLRHEQGGVAVHFVNAYTVSLTTDAVYLRALNQEGVNFADGTPLAFLARRGGKDVAHLRGPDAFRELLAQTRVSGVRHFLLGGTPDSLARLRAVVSSQFPEAEVVGAFSPPFRPMDGEDHVDIDRRISKSGANMVWVGIGTPKQDYEVLRIANRLPVVALAVGAAFNFVSGDVEEAPELWRRTGLEWLYRLFREPRRLWRRYLIGNAKFVILTISRRRKDAVKEGR
ncbi:WecB/TagA/CpsF family glycosyltransferase [Curtobacterium sp. MCBA15_012]|uniref:WecB/TagA/CpsF family glycosyltransferase n=1 Tax=Curtobacterium sp. MCBA15_012 TaxID=1898738 RepID=UPI0009F6C493|nr:WecB/TagA/CpsF family glycosyltransferase [Curtobacterium sp. MCBA15_012]WIB00726.1 WecB/TagA/CpsF family glycosyltransferase [Curtobacterium sp. MCBA15_012]